MGMSWSREQKECLKSAKRYLKSDYKVRRDVLVCFGDQPKARQKKNDVLMIISFTE